MEREEPLHRLARSGPDGEGQGRGARRRPCTQGEGLPVRRRLHLGAQPRAGDEPHRARGARPVDPADRPRPGAQRARLWRPLGPQQGRCAREVGRGAGAYLAPLLRHSAARRREPQGHGGARAALLRKGNPAARPQGRARAGHRTWQFAARPRHGARQAQSGAGHRAQHRDRRADRL